MAGTAHLTHARQRAIRARGYLPITSPPYTVYELSWPNVWQIIDSVPTRLSDDAAANGEDISNPKPSPDGSKAAYDSNFPGPNGEGQVGWAAGGAHVVVSADDAGGPWFRHPSWHPDGTKLVYIHADPAEGTNGSLVTAELANPGTETVLYTPSPVGSPNGYGPYRPQYSPDGTKIAFLLLGEAGHNPALTGLYVMDNDGSNVTLLDNFPVGYAFDGEQFGWAPDGSLIAYRRMQSPSGAFSPLYVIEPDGTNARKISVGDTDNSPDLGASVGKRLSDMCWSPDGSYVIGSAQWWNGSAIVWRPWRFEVDGTTDETRLSDTNGPIDAEFFRTVYVYFDRIWFIDQANPGRVVSLALDGSDHRVGHLLTDDSVGDQFYNGSGFNWR